MVTPTMILNRLPPYLDEWQLIKETQYVPDIMKEVKNAHTLFSGYYDKFSDLFYKPDPVAIADDLYEFCKKYLKYKEEPIKIQTSALPSGIIERGYVTGEGVDCKHYALFCAGVLGSLNRMYRCFCEASFYFVAYGGASEPYHVFVCLKDSENDIWLDPTPGSGGTPTLIIEKPI